MKSYKKDIEDNYICEECGKAYTSKSRLSVHINKLHCGIEEYAQKWIIDLGEDECKICKSKTKFIGLGENNCYKLTCEQIKNRQCSIDYVKKQTVEGVIQIYGVSNIYQTEKFSIKRKAAQYKFYEDKNKVNLSKTKYEQTCIKRYGVKNISQSENYKNKNAFKVGKFKDTNIYYQGSYELDFLNKYFDKFPDIQRGPRIKYLYENKEHFYFSDFYIPSLNLIIECKNKHLYERDCKQIEAKNQYCKINNYNIQLIIEKNYSDFDTFLKSIKNKITK